MVFLSCYNLIKNDCSGACQGCSDCPVCYLYHEGCTNKKLRNQTRWEMIKFALNSKWDRLVLSIIFALHGKKIRKALREKFKK